MTCPHAGRDRPGGRVGRRTGGWNGRYRAVHRIDFTALRRPGTYRIAVGGPVDVEGGWFDAGDFARYTHATAYSTAEMLVVRRSLDRRDRRAAGRLRAATHRAHLASRHRDALNLYDTSASPTPTWSGRCGAPGRGRGSRSPPASSSPPPPPGSTAG